VSSSQNDRLKISDPDTKLTTVLCKFQFWSTEKIPENFSVMVYGYFLFIKLKSIRKKNTCLNHCTKEKNKNIQAGIETLGQWTIEIAAEQIHGSCASLFT